MGKVYWFALIYLQVVKKLKRLLKIVMPYHGITWRRPTELMLFVMKKEIVEKTASLIQIIWFALEKDLE